MYRIESKIDTKNGEYKKNHANMIKVVKQFKERLAEIQKGGPEKYQKLQKSRGKLLARERLDKLFDRNTPFLELNSLAAYDMYDNQAPGASMVTGIGVVHPGSGSSHGEPSSLYLSGGFRRDFSSSSGRNFSG
jgi:3-methylcrotonyl-CoA carboxylase beta subunit